MDRAVPGSDEPALLERLRLGEDAAFSELFEHHAPAVRRLSRSLASDSSEAEDITAETFFRVLQAVRRGNGPRDNVRAYLLTVARRVSWEWHGARRDVPVTDDELTNRVGAGGDAQNRTAEATLITRAFSSLPERWRTVLWQTEVEGVQPASAAQHFGLSANATAALARRARLGLRAAYLQAHLAVNRSSDGCRTVMEKLGGYTAGSVTGAEARKIKAHLGSCSSCRSTHDELREVCSTLRAHAGVVVLLVPAAGLAVGTMSGVGTAGGVASAAGAGGAAVGGAGGGVLAAAGAHVKLGLALASTAAVGAVGVAVGPLNLMDEHIVGLPGEGAGVELQIAEPTPQAELESSAFEAGGLVPGARYSEREHVSVASGAEPAGHLEATEYTIPGGLQIAGEARAGTPAAGTQLPGTHVPPGQAKGNSGNNGNGNNGQGNGNNGEAKGQNGYGNNGNNGKTNGQGNGKGNNGNGNGNGAPRSDPSELSESTIPAYSSTAAMTTTSEPAQSIEPTTPTWRGSPSPEPTTMAALVASTTSTGESAADPAPEQGHGLQPDAGFPPG
ncbi:sigma-70 family RNA polymerase sigma factor [Saccharomonospora sp. NPDC046836]|uniref:sigma-70 family RNA polymerase sigma factor n=1 Tax=Saccharomonospora sp. NPDC046836 TaxID=3156921 RepID=UPI0033D82C0B